MSDADSLADKISDVINDHLATSGGMMTGFVFATDYIDEDGGRSWLYAQAPDQAITATIGMLRWYTLHVEDVSVQAMREDDES